MSASAVLDRLLAKLWTQYVNRVSYAGVYQKMVLERGGVMRNDHIALRTFNTPCGAQKPGVEPLATVFTSLGYERKDKYIFEDKKLTAWHYEHKKNPANPKIFISQLEVDQLSKLTAEKIKQAVADGRDLLTPSEHDILRHLSEGEELNASTADAVATSLAKLFARPWSPPLRSTVEEVDKESQYAAWTLLHGNGVNHFTAYINEQNVKDWPDIEATVDALNRAGVPMKPEFEGERGSKLRQSSTKAVMEDCDVTEADGSIGKINWSYAYYELAERGNVPGPDGKPTRFQAFLGAQATNLFEMTKRG